VAGGGIENSATLTVRGCTLSGNTATGFDFNGFHFAGRGGGIENFSVATIQDSTLSGNTAELGGSISNAPSATLDVRGSTFACNSASDSGGGIYNFGTAVVQQSSFAGNAAGSDGGGIFNGSSGTLAVKDSTVLHNVAPSGADFYNLGALSLDDSTVGVVGP
jgi:hypothetical protein